LHDELEAMTRAGMTNADVLVAATRLSAEWLGLAEDRGTVEQGKRADLILLDGDPMAEIGNTRRISAVIAGGRYLARETLDDMMEDLAGRYAAMPGCGDPADLPGVHDDP
jgi:imidazolonepropionase-like amidohydrolase